MNSRNKKLLLLLIVLMLFVSIGKETYALFTASVSSTVQSYGTGILKLNYSNSVVNLNNAYPMSDSDGMNMRTGIITITNTGTLAYKFNVKVDVSSSSTLSNDLIKVSVDEQNPAFLSADGNIIIRDVVLNPGSSRSFSLKLWIDSSASSSEVLDKKFVGNLTSTGIAVKNTNDSTGTVLAGEETLYLHIKKNANTATTIDFSQTSETSNTNGIYMTTDTENNIPVYYYRGNVDNNHVIFANFCWKIIRTTETGGVKLIYDGIPLNGECNNTGSDTTIGNSPFNSAYNSPAYAGYMYNVIYTIENKDITTLSGSIIFGNDITYDRSTNKYTLKDTYTLTDASNWDSEYETVANKYHYTCFTSSPSCTSVNYMHITYGNKTTSYVVLNNGKNHLDILKEMLYGDINVKDSTIKVLLDTWYKNNMTSYTSQIEDTVFCNDRVYYNLSTSGWNKDYNNYNGYLNFGSKQKLDNRKPNLICPRQIDKFTVSSNNGNGALTYPIGLITAEEISYAGGAIWQTNNSFYLNNGVNTLTFSPFDFGGGVISDFFINSSGYIGNTYVSDSNGIRPVIALKYNTIYTSGSGTSSSPYIVE